MSQWLFVAGSIPLLVLGLLHNLYTLQDLFSPKRIVPSDRDLMDRMKQSGLRLTKGTDMWRAWVGFNFSHGLGAIVIGAFYLYMALGHFDVLRGLPVLFYAAPIIAAIYALLAWRYWFRVPLAGALASLVLFVAGVLV